MPPSMRKGKSYTVGNDIDPIRAPEWLIDIIATRPAPSPKVTLTHNTHLNARTTAPGNRSGKDPFACNDIPPNSLQLASAVAAIPNNDEAWDDWDHTRSGNLRRMRNTRLSNFRSAGRRAREVRPGHDMATMAGNR